jgi:hypothetical protein
VLNTFGLSSDLFHKAVKLLLLYVCNWLEVELKPPPPLCSYPQRWVTLGCHLLLREPADDLASSTDAVMDVQWEADRQILPGKVRGSFLEEGTSKLNLETFVRSLTD